MKFLHLGDLHIGKNVNGFSMLEEQKFALRQAIDLILCKNIDFVLISGDIFDKPVPSVSALEVFNDFLCEISSLDKKIYIISGNHDNLDRISYLSDILKKSNIFISKAFDGEIEFYDFDLKTRIYLLPYLYPAIIRKYFPDVAISNYNDAISVLINNTKLDNKKTNIILAHQFVLGNKDAITSDSEEKTLGGVDIVDYNIFSGFDYCALGHLHCPQKVGVDKIRYCGSLLKYSFSEISQKKKFTIVEIDENKNVSFEFEEIKFVRDFAEYKGYFEEFLDEKFYSKINKEDYIHFTLYDENVIDAKKKLSLIYPNIMLLDFENSFTKNLNSAFNFDFKKEKTILDHFCEFYKMQYGVDIDDKRKSITQDLLNEKQGDEPCAL